MGYSYGTMGGSSRKLCNNSNVWFYPRIRVVPQSEYSYWGITDTNCLVFDTYFLSNSSWTNTGIAADQEIITSSTQLPKKVIFKDETDGSSKEAQAIGYSWWDSTAGDYIYQATWIRPQVIKCTTSKGYITAICCSMSRSINQKLYYMGKGPVKSNTDSFITDPETSDSLKWRVFSTGDTASGEIGDEYYYFNQWSSGTTSDIIYYLFKSVEKIYKYRTFYFIVPTGSGIQFATQGLDFFAYNGWDENYGVINTLQTYKTLINGYDADSNTYPQTCWYFAGWRGTEGSDTGSVDRGELIDNGLAELSSIKPYSTAIKGSKLYDSSQSNNEDKWSAALSEPILLTDFNSSTGTFSSSKRGYGEVEVMEDNTLGIYNKGYNPFPASGLTIDFGEPHCQYMHLSYDCGYNDYYAYVNTACRSLYKCYPVYLSEKLISGMINTTVTDSTTFTTSTSSQTYKGTVTVKNEHDSSGYYKVRLKYYNYDGSWIIWANGGEGWIGDMSSNTYSYSGQTSLSPYYLIQVVCTNISETDLGEEVFVYSKQYSPVTVIGVDTSMNTNFLNNVTLYYNSGSSSSYITNSSSLLPTTYNHPVWYKGSITKITSNTKSWSHSCRQYSRCRCYYRDRGGSWNSYIGSWKYITSFSKSSDTASWYDYDITLTCNWNTNALRKQVYFTTDFEYILPPTIQTCTDAGDWSRSVKVYNPNLISLTLGYSSNKTTSKSSANSGWNTTTLAGLSYTTLTIGDQSGFSDEWILCGFQVGSSLFYCNTIDEDVVSGTPNVVNSIFYYSR